LSPDLVCTGTFDGYFTLINPSFVETLGYREEDFLSTYFLAFVHPDERAAVNAEFESLKTGKPVTHFEARWQHSDGSYRWLSWHAVSVPADRRIYAVARDVTEKRSLEEQLQRQRDEVAHVLRLHTVGEMATEICHELNQPLGAIVNYASGVGNRLRTRGFDDADTIRGIDEIADQARRAGRLIHNIRGFVRRDYLEMEEVDVNAIVEHARELLKVGGDSLVELTCDLDPTLPTIAADPVQIEQVIVNLLRNGIDATRALGNSARSVAIHTTRDSDADVRVTVRDAGIGLRPDTSDKIFDPFFTTKPEGLGMGLSMSRKIVEAHGGQLSGGPNDEGGATFSFTLPIRSEIADVLQHVQNGH
jgi:PAS domain S-box-containing protein